MINDKTYNLMKDIALCWMPYGITFTGVVLATLEVPYSVAIITILTGANAFLGNVVKYYKSRYDKR